MSRQQLPKMNANDSEGSDFEPASQSDNESILGDPGKQPPPLNLGDTNAVSRAVSKANARWKRLQRYYNDDYLELFRRTFESETYVISPDEYQSVQQGSVVWTPAEKSRLFERLQVSGRHDLPALAHSIRTKSLFEVKAYVNLVQQGELDRQLFEKQTRNISLADIPAALEIGLECESNLERAADALAAFQDQYDYAIGQQGSSLPFIITHDVAKQLDERSENITQRFDADESSVDEDEPSTGQPHELFNLVNLVELSQNLYMHGSQQDPKNNWREFAEYDERPAITQQALSDFRDLLMNLLHRIMQTSLFLAQSRVRASTVSDHKPAHNVQPEDIHTALKILHLEKDLWEYWIHLPRRYPFKVVKGTKTKGDSVKGALNYDEVEAALSVRHFSGRRRSLSVMSGTSSDTGAESAASSVTSGDDGESPSAADLPGSEELSLGDNSDISDMEHDEGSPEDEDSSEGSHDQPDRLPPGKRKRQLEEELDEYVEAMDQQARHDEEARLVSLLGLKDAEAIKREPLELGRRPKVLRKSAEDVTIWAGRYVAPWEEHPATQSVG